jgi:hypothetical protein
MKLCLLQKANGSFVLSDDLINAMDLPKAQVDAILAMLGPYDKVVLTTVLALAVLRVNFAKKRSLWELQEQKALALLHGWSNPATAAALLSNAETQVRNLSKFCAP